MTTQTAINSTHWQLSPFDSQQAAMQGIDDIHQCIANILSTLKGSDVLRPEFGSDHIKYIDYPADEAAPHFVREITQALQKWEKRIEVERVEILNEAPHITMTVYWQLTDAVHREIYQTEVTT
ncbi:GPW/gp25 family protein [Actinobacillus suis]|uniref:GPW/gp25 family protein n=1 Tax=Actinobacillus suis TaxID=716 RepID=UPI000E31E23A|nr:GPW/gp25 family protein [Actinobacillus suis]